MAFVEIEDDGPIGSFVKLQAIGDKLSGLFIGSKPSSGGQYTKPGDRDYLILQKDGVKVFGAPTDALRKLKKAEGSGQLKPGCAVMITYTSDLDVGQQSSMRVFKVLIDPEAKPAAVAAVKPHLHLAGDQSQPAQQAAKPAQSKPAPKPAADDPFASADDDIPF
jgi:hypothetical protein